MNTYSGSELRQEAEKLVQDFFNRVWHPPHELDAIDELMSEDYVITTAGSVVKGRDVFKGWVQRFQNLLLEAKTESEDIIYDEIRSKVVSRWVCSGKNNGILGLEPDGRFVSFTGIAIWSIRDGRLAECWLERSAYELYQQLISESGDKKFV